MSFSKPIAGIAKQKELSVHKSLTNGRKLKTQEIEKTNSVRKAKHFELNPNNQNPNEFDQMKTKHKQ